MIDMASVFAERFKGNPQPLQAAVMGQGNVPNLDSYTALRALQLIKESNAAMMAQQARGPVGEQPSLASTAVSPQGLTMPPQMGAPVMGQAQPPQGPPMAQAPQGPPMPQRPPMPPPVMQRSGGLAGLPVSNHGYAPGGIVAFAEGGGGYSEVTGVSGPESVDLSADMYANQSDDNTAEDGEGDLSLQSTAFQNYLASRKALGDITNEGLTPAEEDTQYQRYMRRMKDAAGPDIYGPMKAQLESQEKDRAGTLNQGQGMALLQAAGAMLKGSNFARGAGEAASTYAQAYGQALQADKAEKRSIASMQFNLADAQRKERMGDVRGAMSAMESARRDRAEGSKFKFEKARALANIDANAVRNTRPLAGRGGAGAQPNAVNILNNALEALADDPTNPRKQLAVKNARESVAASKSSFSMSDIPAGGKKADIAQQGVDETVLARQSKENLAATTALSKLKRIYKADWRKLVEAAGGDEAKAEATYKKSWLTQNPGSGAENFDPATAQPTMPARAGSAPHPPAGFKLSGSN